MMLTLVHGLFKILKGEGEKCHGRSYAAPRFGFSVHSSHGTAKNCGFTLIEMLVVLLIMGLLVGLVSAVAQPDDRAKLRVEAERLAQLMDIATTQSRLTGKPIAWTADGQSYRFWQFNEDPGWSEITDDEYLRARILPKGMTISNMKVENTRSPEHMRVEFNAYGSVLSFSVEMSLGDAHCTVASSPIGEVRVLPEERRTNDKLAFP